MPPLCAHCNGGQMRKGAPTVPRPPSLNGSGTSAPIAAAL
ncbi:hypothetical protein TR2A62_2158 [Thalassobium sp. R2A62]|nr:hypothetical protein TR2A62_2158 [Thalassobium sp. R2A62]